MRLILTLLAIFGCCVAESADFNPDRARFNYQMSCQGCHTSTGAGVRAVPPLKDFVGYFLDFPEGREYLVRVPGSAIAALDNDDLAEVLNWIVREFGGESVHEPFAPYTANEVAKLRKWPLNEVEQYRGKMVAEMSRVRFARDN